MSTLIAANTLAQLIPLANKDGLLEIFIRGKNQRFVRCVKVLIQDLIQAPDLAQMQMLGNIANLAQQNLAVSMASLPLNMANLKVSRMNLKLSQKSLKYLTKISCMQNVGLLLNGVNLCATCAGFAIVCAKLDQMSEELKREIGLVHQTVKQGIDLNSQFEFNKVLGDHKNMLDCRKKKKPYSEDQLRALIDREYSVFMMFVEIFRKDISDDSSALIFSLFTLLYMLSVSIREFDEVYYFNNRDALGKEEAWHTSRDTWISAFSFAEKPWFREKVQDYAYLTSELGAQEADYYCSNLLNDVIDMRLSLEDNRKIILALDNADLLRQFEALSNQEVREELESVVKETLGDEALEQKFYQDVLQQAALA